MSQYLDAQDEDVVDVNEDGSLSWPSDSLISQWTREKGFMDYLDDINFKEVMEQLKIVEIENTYVFAFVSDKGMRIKEISPRYLTRHELERFILYRWHGYESILDRYARQGCLDVDIPAFFLWEPKYGDHRYPRVDLVD